ncbi:methyltransferase domain-containing protein [Ditylenchus destructor]|uniref:Methyltransferase domain-containing protein n=1 Tax=Ditylenchus destructor TaxID=166010 RepID=A0AAD4MTB7_9BILA|nr:methyltransferase domain-containing protein [Ditylenchus destructor]
MTEEFPAEKYLEATERDPCQLYVVNPTIEATVGREVKGKRVLDVGCGNGEITRKLVDEWGAKEAVGVDSSEERVNTARSRKTNVDNTPISFVHKSALDLEFSHEFDVATAFFVLDLNSNLEQLSRAIRNIARALKPGGIFFAYVMNGIQDLNPRAEKPIECGARLILNPGPRYDGERIKIQFYTAGRPAADTTLTFFFRETYEKCLRETGFAQIQWINPIVSDEGIAKLGKDYFESFLDLPDDVMFRAVLEKKKNW